MNKIYTSVRLEASYWKRYLAILENKKVANDRNAVKRIIQEATEELACYFQKIYLNRDCIFAYLTTHLQENPEIFASAFAFSPEICVSCPFVFRDVDGFKNKDIANQFGYTHSAWYDVPIKQGKAIWSVPYFDIGKAGEDILLTTYSVPVLNKNFKIVGVIISDLLLAKLEDVRKN